MFEMHQHAWLTRTRPYVVCYSLYAVLLALSITVLLLWRQAVLYAVAAFVDTGDGARLIFDLTLLMIGMLLFVIVLGAEPYLRHGVTRHQLALRFLRMFVLVTGVGAVGLGIQLVALWAMR